MFSDVYLYLLLYLAVKLINGTLSTLTDEPSNGCLESTGCPMVTQCEPTLFAYW